jgi:hypothetical protein
VNRAAKYAYGIAIAQSERDTQACYRLAMRQDSPRKILHRSRQKPFALRLPVGIFPAHKENAPQHRPPDL